MIFSLNLVFVNISDGDFIHLFLEEKGGRKGDKHQCVAASRAPPTGDLARNPGMCPDWESNPQPFGSALNPLSHTSQGSDDDFEKNKGKTLYSWHGLKKHR